MYRPAVAYRYSLSLTSTSMTFLTSGMMHTACVIPGLADRRERLLQQLSIERRGRRNTKAQAQQEGKYDERRPKHY